MRIQLDGQVSFEVYCDPADREVGYEDDIHFGILETGPKELRMFQADETIILLTCDQAEHLAAALVAAAAASRSVPR